MAKTPAKKAAKKAVAKKQKPSELAGTNAVVASASPGLEHVTTPTDTLERKNVTIELLEANEYNPNEMSERQFNMLVDNMEKVGFTDPLLVRPHPDKPGKYRIVGGHHRWEVAKMLGYTEVPCTIITDPSFDDDKEKFQVVRHNIIKGRMSPAKFLKMYESLSAQYAEDVAAELFGFTDEDEFAKLIKATEKSLPKELQQQFKEAASELKTIDDLSKLLNGLFAQYGDTLPHGYMFLDFGGYESVWLRLQKNQLLNFREVADRVRTEGKALDHIMAGLLQLIAKKDEMIEPMFAAILAAAPEVKIHADASYATLDFLDATTAVEPAADEADAAT